MQQFNSQTSLRVDDKSEEKKSHSKANLSQHSSGSISKFTMPSSTMVMGSLIGEQIIEEESDSDVTPFSNKPKK